MNKKIDDKEKDIITLSQNKSKNSIEEKIEWKELILLVIGMVTITSVILSCWVLWPEKTVTVMMIFLCIIVSIVGVAGFLEQCAKNSPALIIFLCGIQVVALVTQYAFLFKIGCI